MKPGLLEAPEHMQEWTAGVQQTVEIAIVKNFHDNGLVGDKPLAEVLELATEGELHRAALHFLLGKADVAGYQKLAQQYLLWRPGGAATGCCHHPQTPGQADLRDPRAGTPAGLRREHLLDNPSAVVLTECCVTPYGDHPRTSTPLEVFLDHRKPIKGELYVRLAERPALSRRKVAKVRKA